jgi:cell division protein FtsZ
MFEGAQRKNVAERGLTELTDKVDTIITIPNDKLMQVIDKKTSLLDAFSIVDDVLHQGVQGIAELITVPGLINVDFADVKAIMANSGSALMGIGVSSGENKAIEAAKTAVSSPLLEMSIEGARGILFTITGGNNLGMAEVNEAAKIITAASEEDAKIIFGAVIDDKMKDEIKVTVCATGFDGRVGGGGRQEANYTQNSFIAQKEQEEKTIETETKKSKISSLKAAQAEPARKKEAVVEEEDDEEGELGIPAFIRKKMM